MLWYFLRIFEKRIIKRAGSKSNYGSYFKIHDSLSKKYFTSSIWNLQFKITLDLWQLQNDKKNL